MNIMNNNKNLSLKMSLSLSLPLSLKISLSLSPCLCLSVCMYACMYLFLSAYLELWKGACVPNCIWGVSRTICWSQFFQSIITTPKTQFLSSGLITSHLIHYAVSMAQNFPLFVVWVLHYSVFLKITLILICMHVCMSMWVYTVWV